jgi:hypothetical protein
LSLQIEVGLKDLIDVTSIELGDHLDFVEGESSDPVDSPNKQIPGVGSQKIEDGVDRFGEVVHFETEQHRETGVLGGLVSPEVAKNRIRFPHPEQVLSETNLLDASCCGRFDVTLDVLTGKRPGIGRARHRVIMGMQVEVVVTQLFCPITEVSRGRIPRSWREVRTGSPHRNSKPRVSCRAHEPGPSDQSR